MEEMLKIVYWSDYACPFCFIGERNLKTAMDELGIRQNCTLEMKAFELNPQSPDVITGNTNELLAKKYGLSTREADTQIARIEAMGRDAGIAFDYANTKYGNTRKAHMLTKKALHRGGLIMADCLIEVLFSAFFEKNALLSDKEVLVKCGMEAGLNEEEARQALNDQTILGEVLDDEEKAACMGISGVPYFVIEDKYVVPSALSVDEMKKVLLQLLERKGITLENKSMSCGPDGSCS